MKKSIAIIGILSSFTAFAGQSVSHKGSSSMEFWGRTPNKLEMLGIERLAQLDALSKCQNDTRRSCTIIETIAAQCDSIQDDMAEGLSCFSSATAQ